MLHLRSKCAQFLLGGFVHSRNFCNKAFDFYHKHGTQRIAAKGNCDHNCRCQHQEPDIPFDTQLFIQKLYNWIYNQRNNKAHYKGHKKPQHFRHNYNYRKHSQQCQQQIADNFQIFYEGFLCLFCHNAASFCIKYAALSFIILLLHIIFLVVYIKLFAAE